MGECIAKAYYSGGRPGYSITSPYTGTRYIFVGAGIPAKIEDEKDVDFLISASPDITVIRQIPVSKDKGSVAGAKKPTKANKPKEDES